MEFISAHTIKHTHPKLLEYLIGDIEDFEDPLLLFEGDPDMLRLYGHTSYFMDIEFEDTKYVIVSGDISEVKRSLETFLDSEKLHEYWEYPETNNWDAFWHTDNAIAYRGGSGYVYSIWHFKED